MSNYMSFNGLSWNGLSYNGPAYNGPGFKAGSRPYTSASAMVATVRQLVPQGADHLVIGVAAQPFVRVTTNSKGIIAILIGLLLPAVQKLHVTGGADLQEMRRALKPTGTIGFALCDGSVRPAAGSTAAPGRTLSFTEVTGLDIQIT
jgi:hypothetical protein